MTASDCPLCRSDDVRLLVEVHGRRFLECAECRLAFMHPADRLSPVEELQHYDTHENDPADPAYRRFLGRLVEPLLERIEPGARGLDYGCGPGPALGQMMAERGFPLSLYDPFFEPDLDALGRRYDFITCTEVIEHFHQPEEEFEWLSAMLADGGILAVMTELRDDRDLKEWRYARDPTHVSLYHSRTLQWLGERFGWGMERVSQTVTFYQAESR